MLTEHFLDPKIIKSWITFKILQLKRLLKKLKYLINNFLYPIELLLA